MSPVKHFFTNLRWNLKVVRFFLTLNIAFLAKNKIFLNILTSVSGPQDDGGQESEGWTGAADRHPSYSLPRQGKLSITYVRLSFFGAWGKGAKTRIDTDVKWQNWQTKWNTE